MAAQIANVARTTNSGCLVFDGGEVRDAPPRRSTGTAALPRNCFGKYRGSAL